MVWPDEGTVEFDWYRANVKHIAGHRVTPAEAEQALVNDPFDRSALVQPAGCWCVRTSARKGFE